MAGLRQVVERNPAVVKNIEEIHAMFATWGNVALMDLGGASRGTQQFNVACDPSSANFVLKGIDCPIYLMPTEVTCHTPIGFSNVQELRKFLPNNSGVNKLLAFYTIWYDAAVRPRQAKNPEELIYIHDLVSAFSLDADLRDKIYRTVPTVIERVPFLPNESAEWGTVKMRLAKKDEPTNVLVSTGFKDGGEKIYLEALCNVFK